MLNKAKVSYFLIEVVLIVIFCFIFFSIFNIYMFDPLVAFILYIAYWTCKKMVVSKTPQDLFKHVYL